MAQSVEDIRKVITDKVTSTPVLAPLAAAFSKVSLWYLFADCVAYCIQQLQFLFEQHRTDIDAALELQLPHRLTWYKEKALRFRYGYNVIVDTDKYDNTGLTTDQIETAEIVKYAAVTESQVLNDTELLVKIAGEAGDELQPITGPQLAAFKYYINYIKDGGVGITVVNYLPDRLYLTIQIYYNPLVLAADGSSILDGNKPVEDALTAFRRELPFNGELVLASLVDKLQTVPGVVIPNLVNATTSWINPDINDYGTAEPINVKKVPYSGYFTIVNFDNITYIANV